MKRRIVAISALAVLLLCGVVWARIIPGTVVVGQGVSGGDPDACTEGQIALGTNTVQTSNDYGGDSTMIFRMQALCTGTVNKIFWRLYYWDAGTDLTPVAYADSSSEPASRIGIGSSVDLGASNWVDKWEELPLSTTFAITKDSYYWIGVGISADGSPGSKRAASSGAGRYSNTVTPTPWSNDGTKDFLYSVYATAQ